MLSGDIQSCSTHAGTTSTQIKERPDDFTCKNKHPSLPCRCTVSGRNRRGCLDDSCCLVLLSVKLECLRLRPPTLQACFLICVPLELSHWTSPIESLPLEVFFAFFHWKFPFGIFPMESSHRKCPIGSVPFDLFPCEFSHCNFLFGIVSPVGILYLELSFFFSHRNSPSRILPLEFSQWYFPLEFSH